MKTYNKIFAIGALALLTGCNDEMPRIVEFPYTEGNTVVPQTEVMEIERTDSFTVITLMTMYDYYDTDLQFNHDTYLTTGDYDHRPLKSVQNEGPMDTENNKILLKKGIPVRYKLTFPPIPKDAEYVDLVGVTTSIHGPGSIWGIDLTGKRSANEPPTGIPAGLSEFDLINDTLPHIVRAEGTATVNLHIVGFRPWMSRNGRMWVNTIDDTQENYPLYFSEQGDATVEIPLKGTANINVNISTNTYASTFVDPEETMDMYIVSNNYSDARPINPMSVTNGKYRNSAAVDYPLWKLNSINADTLLAGKTDRDEYFNALLQVYDIFTDSIAAQKFPPLAEKVARGWLDRLLMSCTSTSMRFISQNNNGDKSCKPDSIDAFTPEQLNEIRSRIDFTNPALELYSIGNPGARTRYLRAIEMLNYSN